MILTTTSLITILTSCIPAIDSIYSDNNILEYDVHHTTSDFNQIFILSELVPVFLLAILNPLVLMYRVNGLRKYIVKLQSVVFGGCKAAITKNTEVDV